MATFVKGFMFVVGVIATFLIIGVLMGYPTKWVVNYLFAPSLLVAIFGVSKLSIWQAIALNFASACLFKSTNWTGKK